MFIRKQLTLAIRRWYLTKNGADGTYYLGGNSPTQPVTVHVNDEWSAELPMKGVVEAGHYRVVLCVTPRCTDLSSIKGVEIECVMARSDGDYVLNLHDTATETSVPREEIYKFPPERFTRLKMHKQVYNYDEVASLYVNIEFEMENENENGKDGGDKSPFMDIHYIEIEANQARPREDRDHVVYGDGMPSQIIRVGVDNMPYTRPVEITSFNFSDSGEFVATIYFTEGLAHVDVWDLNAKSSSSPQVSTTPCAQTTFPVSKIFNNSNTWSYVEVNLKISRTGSQVALCTEEESGNGISFRVFKMAPAAPVDHDPSRPWSLKRATTICDGGFYSAFAYHSSDPLNAKEEDERFCICDGLSFTVFSTEDNWTQMYKLSMQHQLNLSTAYVALNTLQGRYFAWLNIGGAISIWDFETGKLISHVFTGTGAAINPALSRDGSMLAVSIKGTVQVYDTLSGIKLGVLREGLTEESEYQVVFGQNHLLIYNIIDEPSESTPLNHDVLSIVNVRDMSIVDNLDMHEDYSVNYLQACQTLLFSYNEGSNLNLLKKDDVLSPNQVTECGVDGVCERKPIKPFAIFPDFDQTVENTKGSKFILGCRVPLIANEYVRVLDVTVDGDGKGGGARSMTIPVGDDVADCYGFFIPATSRLIFLERNNLLVWTLSADSPRICELDTFMSAHACDHGRNFSIELSKVAWYRTIPSYRELGYKGGIDTLTMPVSPADTLPTSEEYRYVQGIARLIEVYAKANEECSQAVISYLKERIRPTPKHPVSCLITICRSWTVDNRSNVELMVGELLPNDCITWIPDIKATKELNPLAIIMEYANENPIAVKVARIIMDYCTSHANKSRNLAFVAPFFGSLYKIMNLFPNEALNQLSRLSYIPVKSRSYIMDNHILVHHPKFRLQCWKPNKRPLSKTKYPVMQLHISGEQPDPTNVSFTGPVFMASFDALWYYMDAVPLSSSTEVKAEASDTTTTTWWKTLYQMIRLKSRLRVHSYVECYDFTIEFFDNPAIAALVTYKWNTIGYVYWMVRFTFQCLYYALVVIAAIMQIYYPKPSKLVGLFIAIIALSVVFLWLELLQAYRSLSRYTRLSYNFLDMGAFCLPMVAGIQQLVVIYRGDSSGNIRLVSFSVLVVFIHMLFELRINKSVCKYVTIIQETVHEIRVFFFIFFAGIVAFAIAILHMLRGCPYEGCPEATTELSDHPIGALFATYFFMGGIWDPVSKEFTQDKWAFQLMMAIFFFFSVILMLNVLIALINKAFEKGDDGWRLVWIESRLHHIESAENMSYHIPGFRQTYNYFPKEIYFSATLQQVKEYREKYRVVKEEGVQDELDIAEDWLDDAYDEDGYTDEKAKDQDGVKKDEDSKNDINHADDGAGAGEDEDDSEDEDKDEDDDDGKSQKAAKPAGKDSDKAVKKTEKDRNKNKNESKGKEKDKKDREKDKGKKSKKASGGPGWITEDEDDDDDEEEAETGDEEESTMRRVRKVKDPKTIPRLNLKLGDLHGEVGDLKAQIRDLQKQLSAQLSAQQEQTLRHRDGHQELKNLLMSLRPSSA
ncbi:hypothetical protein BGZ65_000070 [Modicella reniformis]|uniref:Ion transport domain-containing protein n=1 Tax=Modicella reniformis TaxID=1440133 RepID=A0A9P6J358_9FUNG|nr:hypothetical protein BGZ65_000070 [Modicella reniformis]